MVIEHEYGRPPYPQVAEDEYCAPYLYLLNEEGPGALTQTTEYTKRKLTQVQRAIAAGHGLGRGDNYVPWIPIRRNFSSPVSHQHFESVSIQKRNHHFLSKLEFHTALQVAYLGHEELREGLPAWPIEHPHPDSFPCRADSWTQIKFVPGLLDLARDAGIDHGHFIGTSVPYVATIDLVFRPIDQRSCPGLLSISCKPAGIYTASTRARERVALDAIYCAATGTRHVLEDGAGIEKALVRNLEWLRPLTEEVREWAQSDLLQDFVGTFERHADNMSISQAARASAKRLRISDELGYLMFRTGCWLRMVDIDLSRPIQMTRTINRGREQVVRRLMARYLGASQ
ncbi:hypothetical protein EYS42_12885 [Aquabacterium lacunae]|uniref:Uncharacterized protein n=1 Tax=Aquabacterium lacunae TaxID=2528630 RepID=A0A4Q9GX20_9BURK|nr:hypothetical protein [Aquabacterium lacunae]TBO29300.1 hypothetical protein EYS42_12885 [Aquabacterium lacunae]